MLTIQIRSDADTNLSCLDVGVESRKKKTGGRQLNHYYRLSETVDQYLDCVDSDGSCVDSGPVLFGRERRKR